MPILLKSDVTEAIASMFLQLDEANTLLKAGPESDLASGEYMAGGLPLAAVAGVIVWQAVLALCRGVMRRCCRAAVRRVIGWRSVRAPNDHRVTDAALDRRDGVLNDEDSASTA